MVQDISKRFNFSKIYTNHSLRATSVHILDTAEFAGRHIISVTGHQSESSLKPYTGYTDENTKRKMSKSLGNSLVTNKKKRCEAASIAPLDHEVLQPLSVIIIMVYLTSHQHISGHTAPINLFLTLTVKLHNWTIYFQIVLSLNHYQIVRCRTWYIVAGRHQSRHRHSKCYRVWWVNANNAIPIFTNTWSKNQCELETINFNQAATKTQRHK